MIVPDASVVLVLLLRTEVGDVALLRLLDPHETLHAPHLLDLEVAQVLRRFALAGELSDARAREALSDLADLPIRRYPHDLFLDRVWQLRHNVTAYDAAYLALAELLPATLLTCDTRLAGIPGVTATVEVV